MALDYTLNDDDASRNRKPIKEKGKLDDFIDEEKKETIRYSAIIPTEIVEIIKDGVYAKKLNGDFDATQADVLIEAMEDYKAKHNVQPRPEEVKQKEQRNRKR